VAAGAAALLEVPAPLEALPLVQFSEIMFTELTFRLSAPLEVPEMETVWPICGVNCELLSDWMVQLLPLLSVREKFPPEPCRQPVTEVCPPFAPLMSGVELGAVCCAEPWSGFPAGALLGWLGWLWSGAGVCVCDCDADGAAFGSVVLLCCATAKPAVSNRTVMP
jgi:hypothetical protein